MKKMLCIFGLLTSIPAFSATWVEYDSRTNNAAFYYDQDSVKIKKLGNGTKYIEVWEKVDYSTPQLQTIYSSNCSEYITTNCNEYYQQAKTKFAYDCWNDKFESLYRIDYDSNGNSIDSSNFSHLTSFSSSDSWIEVIPDTVGERKLKQICSTYRHRLK